jgi:AraC-like DNA-binding protein
MHASVPIHCDLRTNYFYIIFKKFTGLSPSEFRESEGKSS